MKHLKVVGLTLLSISLISGCASTDDSLQKDASGNFVYPPMIPLTTENYVWDDSVSEATNVAKMAQPAGVARGMSDFVDGKQASIGLLGTGIRVFDGAVGLLSGGLFGLVQQESLSQGVNNQVEWKPTVVDIVDKETISENGQISFVKTRQYIAEKVKKAIEVDHPNIIWGDTLTLKRRNFETDFYQIIKSNECQQIQNFDKGGKENVKLVTNNYSKYFYEGKDSVETYCAYSMKLNVSYSIDSKSVVIVAESAKGHYLDKSVALNYDGYVLVPDVYFANSNYTVTNPYAFVTKSGEELLFQKP
tara:strand:+ start:66 stop:977 length:912 start_codon:yes stop_codon:yes gene_type:complete